MQTQARTDKAPLWVSGLVIIGASVGLWTLIIGAVYYATH